MDGPIIETPRGEIIVTKAGKAQLAWNSNFHSICQNNYTEAQKYVDSEVLRLSTPLIPIRSSALIKSGILGTVVGSGLVRWIAPYAASQYYDTATSRPYDPLRGAFWFERMKAISGSQIIAGAKRKAATGK
jgi:hypothetical protein